MTNIMTKELYNKSKVLFTNIRTKGKNGISNKWAYYFCKSILKKKKDIKKIKQDDASNPNGVSINQKLTKAEYTAIMKKYCAWVEKHKAVPNYITVKGKKVKPRIWNAYVGYLFKVYYETGKLPASQPIQSNIYKKTSTTKTTTSTKKTSSTPKLHDYLTNSGCSGIGQCTGWYCACNSLQQSFYRLTGIKVDEKTLAGWAGTTHDGTDHPGIATAVAKFNKKYNKNVKLTWYNFSELGNSSSARWSKIKSLNSKGAVFFHLLYRDQWGHYEPIKSVGDSLKILNSLGDQCGSGTYCGYIETRSRSTQERYIGGISQKSVAFLMNG